MVKRKKKIDVSEFELSILDSLWERGEATIRQIADDVYGNAGQVQYATTQKLLERLEDKKCVRRDRSSFKHKFKALIERSDLIDHSLQTLASKLCAGSLAPLLMHLAGQVKLTDEERQRLRKLIDETE